MSYVSQKLLKKFENNKNRLTVNLRTYNSLYPQLIKLKPNVVFSAEEQNTLNSMVKQEQIYEQLTNKYQSNNPLNKESINQLNAALCNYVESIVAVNKIIKFFLYPKT
jgi:hypothetical protein